jgi:hypothetical protein
VLIAMIVSLIGFAFYRNFGRAKRPHSLEVSQ